MAQAEDNKILKGQDKILTLRLRDASDDPWDLTGKYIRARYKVSGNVVTKECTISGNALIGKVILILLGAQTMSFDEGDFVLDIAVATSFITTVPDDWNVDGGTPDVIEQIWTSTGGFQVVALGNGDLT